jgi:hypothetical protein
MKKLLILIVAVALYFHYYPNEQVNTWLTDKKEWLLEYFSDATDTQVRLKSDKIYQDLSSQFSHFNDNEKSYLATMTSSRKSVKAFFNEYCETGKQSANFHKDNQIKVCQTISSYSNLL